MPDPLRVQADNPDLVSVQVLIPRWMQAILVSYAIRNQHSRSETYFAALKFAASHASFEDFLKAQPHVYHDTYLQE